MNRDTLDTALSEQPNRGRLRPTLFVGLGGTGHRIVVYLKALALARWGSERVGQTLKFLVFDTAYESLTVSSLEVGTEFIDIGETPVGKIKRNLDFHTAIRARLGDIMASLPPTALRNGAKQLRPLGLLAFLWRYADVEKHLHNAIWELAGRQRSEGRQGINVFIINSLVGGTGSGIFLDIAYLVRDRFDHLGGLADFCFITGVGVLPRAFHGIQGGNLVPNAVAALKELNRCMTKGDFTASYLNGHTITTTEPPFNIYYLLDGVDEQGHTWRGLDEVCRLGAEAIFLQMGSQVGQKQENAFDNVDEVLVQQTPEGNGTFCGSFGLAALVFSGPALVRTCASRQAVRLIQAGLLAAPPQSPEGLVEDLLSAAGLDPAGLEERLACDDQGTPLSVELAVPGWAQAVPGELVRYVRDYERVRLSTDFKRWLSQNEARAAGLAGEVVADRLARQARQAGLPAASALAGEVLAWLEERAAPLIARQGEDENRLAGLSRDVAHLETDFLQAGEGIFLGRGGRVARAQRAYFAAVQRLFGLRWRVQVTASILSVFNHVARVARDGLAACQAATGRLEAVRRVLDETGAVNPAGIEGDLVGVTTRSLADVALVDELFERYAPPVADLQAILFSGKDSPLDWHDQPLDQIQAALIAACLPAFQPVAEMSVEDAVTLLTGDEVTPEGYYRWLMEQATPSWNLDRTRLPDSGSGLQCLQVLGVPDETHSLYRQHAGMLVSTGDPSRLVAFVARIGAPHTALQGWDSYQAAYERARGHVPLHILDQFQTDNKHAHQTFALAWVSEFIKNQGAYFYYYPADDLEPPARLGQGLANALHAFSNQESLVWEARERVEEREARRGVEATLRDLTAFYTSDERKEGAGQARDDLGLELKRLVRDHADELREIHRLAPGPRPAQEETGGDHEG